MDGMELQRKAHEMAVIKLIENNPDEFERYFIDYFSKLKEERQNGKGTGQRKAGDD